MAYSLQFGGNDQSGFIDLWVTLLLRHLWLLQLMTIITSCEISQIWRNLSVLVDEVEYISYTFDQLEPFYQEAPYVGVGLWDGEWQFKIC